MRAFPFFGSSGIVRESDVYFLLKLPQRGVAGFAQVGEWLKPTDCKSAPPCEVRRFESFPVHQSGCVGWEVTVAIKKKFVLALIAYAVLGGLAWITLSDEPIRVFSLDVRLRAATLLILGLFAFRAALYFWRTRIEEADEARRNAGESELSKPM